VNEAVMAVVHEIRGSLKSGKLRDFADVEPIGGSYGAV
jgi:hypothetical protein